MPSRKLDFRLALMVILTFFNIAGTHIPAIVFIIVHLAGVVSSNKYCVPSLISLELKYNPLELNDESLTLSESYGIKEDVYCRECYPDSRFCPTVLHLPRHNPGATGCLQGVLLLSGRFEFDNPLLLMPPIKY